MTSRSDAVAQDFLALLKIIFGVDRAFSTRDVLNAAEKNAVLRVFLSRTGLMNCVALGMYLSACEGMVIPGARLWRERESRRSHVYSLRSA